MRPEREADAGGTRARPPRRRVREHAADTQRPHLAGRHRRRRGQSRRAACAELPQLEARELTEGSVPRVRFGRLLKGECFSFTRVSRPMQLLEFNKVERTCPLHFLLYAQVLVQTNSFII